MLNTVERIITWATGDKTHFSAKVTNYFNREWILTFVEYENEEERARIHLKYSTEEQAIRAAEALAGLPPKTPNPIIVQKEPYKIVPLGPTKFVPGSWNPKITC